MIMEGHTRNWDQGGLRGRKLLDQKLEGDHWLCPNPFLSPGFKF